MTTLHEYETKVVDLPAPPAPVQDQLARDLDDRLEVLWLAGGRARLRSGAWVGVVRFAGETIRILPKLAGDELDVMTMLGLSAGLPLADLMRLERDIDLGTGGDLLDVMCRMLCQETNALLAGGLLQDYRDEHDDLPMLRGRLDVARQATHHYGRVDVLACRYEHFDHDVLDNRVLRAALDVARLAAGTPALRATAAALQADLAALAPGPMPEAAEVRRRLNYDRRNNHYRRAHVWALALIEGHRLRTPFEDVGHGTSVFLLNMNTLFEQFVEWLVVRTLAGDGTSVLAQYRDASILWHGTRSWGSVRPDLLVRRGGQSLAIDAKYKRYDLKRVAVGDVYQLFLYAQAYPGFGDLPRSVLIYPSEGDMQDLVLQLRPRTTAEAAVHCLGIAMPPLLRTLRGGGPAADTATGAVRSRLILALGIEPSPPAAPSAERDIA